MAEADANGDGKVSNHYTHLIRSSSEILLYIYTHIPGPRIVHSIIRVGNFNLTCLALYSSILCGM